MNELFLSVGQAAQAFALVTAVYGTLVGILAIQLRREALLTSTIRAVQATFGLFTIASIGLWAAFLGDRFDVEYVFMYSSRDLPTAYKFAAFWGGQKGSLMLWGPHACRLLGGGGSAPQG